MLHHATRTIRPPQLDECIVFYGILGFTPVDVPPGVAGRAVWLEARSGANRTQIHLMPDDDAVPAQGHIAVVCADYRDTLARLAASGHSVQSRRQHWGSPRAYVRDPAGNLVEVMEWGP